MTGISTLYKHASIPSCPQIYKGEEIEVGAGYTDAHVRRVAFPISSRESITPAIKLLPRLPLTTGSVVLFLEYPQHTQCKIN